MESLPRYYIIQFHAMVFIAIISTSRGTQSRLTFRNQGGRNCTIDAGYEHKGRLLAAAKNDESVRTDVCGHSLFFF